MRLNILVKLLTAGVGLSILPLLAVLVLTTQQTGSALNTIELETQKLASADLQHIVEGVKSMCMSQQDLLEQMVDANLNMAFYMAREMGGVSLGEGEWPWSAVNQFTKSSQQLNLPQMEIGGVPIHKTDSLSDNARLVDDITKMAGGTCTIFQRMNRAGDMLRVSTNVKKLDGKRAIGTYIPAVNPDGVKNKVIATVMSGKRFVGRAYVVNAWYVTAYEPIFGPDRDIIGVLYYGVREDSAKSMRSEILAMQVGQAGEVMVMDGSGALIISEDGARDGKSLKDIRSTNGDPVVQEIIGAAKKLGDEIGSASFTAPDLGLGDGELTIRYTYFPKWNWIILAVAPSKDIYAAVEKAQALESELIKVNITIIIVSVVLLSVIWFIVAKRFISPIRRCIRFAEDVAEGNLERSLNINTKDEVGVLARALKTMLANLKTHMEKAAETAARAESEAQKAQRATARAEEALKSAEEARLDGSRQAAHKLEAIVSSINNVAQDLSARTRSISGGAHAQADRMHSTATAMEQMNTAVIDVARNASEAAEVSETAKTRAQEGADSVGQTIQAMQTTQEKSMRLKDEMNQLEEQADAIGRIMTVIEDIADQTNLLALNAAIEAARAGEAGRGFAVVADEVRKLAEKTMGATKEVGDSIRSIQEAAGRNIEFMDAAVQNLEQAVKLTHSSGEVLHGLVETSETSAQQIRSIATASEEQSATSEEINRSVEEVHRLSAETEDEVNNASASIDELSGQLSELQTLIQELKAEY